MLDDRKRKFKLLYPGNIVEISDIILGIENKGFYKLYNVKTNKFLDGDFYNFIELDKNKMMLLGVDSNNTFYLVLFKSGKIVRCNANSIINRDFEVDTGIDLVVNYHTKDMKIKSIQFLDKDNGKEIGLVDKEIADWSFIDLSEVEVERHGKMVRLFDNSGKPTEDGQIYANRSGVYRGVSIFGIHKVIKKL